MTNKTEIWTVDPANPGIVLIDPTDPFAGILCGTKAPLVSAAPDLLAAAKWAEAALAPFSKDPAEKSGISLLRAAIAKAEGRS